MKQLEMKHMTLVGLMTALLCILGPLSITLPFTPVPISFTNLGIYFIAFVLGWKLTTISFVLYLCIGMAGLPVFSAFSGGLAKLAGPTGGYLIGFIFMAVIAGWFIETFEGNYVLYFVGMILATIVTYAFGTAWLCAQMNLTATQGLAAGVIPYIPGDIVKMVIAVIVGEKVRKTIKKAGILSR